MSYFVTRKQNENRYVVPEFHKIRFWTLPWGRETGDEKMMYV